MRCGAAGADGSETEPVRPSRSDLEVVGVFNPAVTRHDKNVLLLLRVAEEPLELSSGEIAAPVFNANSGQLQVQRWAADAGISGAVRFSGGSLMDAASVSPLRSVRSCVLIFLAWRGR